MGGSVLVGEELHVAESLGRRRFSLLQEVTFYDARV